jgi:homoserine O-acetyltransferase
MPYNARNTHSALKALKNDTQIAEIPGPLGHLEGVLGVQKHSSTIAAFLAN